MDDLAFDCDLKGIRLTVVWVHCDIETLKGRLVARGAARDRWKLVNWTEWVSTLSTPPLRPSDVMVDNSRDSVASLASVVDELAGRLQHG
jgi:hypothetical protein